MSRFIGNVSAYAYAVSQGYTGTEEEYAELMASYATVAEEAAESAESASQSATSASASASTATAKASEASVSATQAGASATSASQSATTATTKASEASQSAQTATTKASEASASASTAGTKASEASASATTASSKASEASASATSAQTAQGLAEVARDDAIDAKTDAESARDLAQQYAESIDPDNIFSAYATDTASGSVATFEDGADDIPMKSVKVAIEPVQDLHGYDHPWPAGGGKNILPLMTNETESKNGLTFTRNANGSISMSGTITESSAIFFVNFTLPAGSYTFSNIGSNTSSTGANADFYIRDLDKEETLASISYNTLADNQNFTLTETTNVRFYTVVQIGATISGTVYPMIRKSTESDNTYAPYSNICPISGWTGAQVSHSGADRTNPTTYSITFPTEAGTVYGGELDVTNGTLTVDRVGIKGVNVARVGQTGSGVCYADTTYDYADLVQNITTISDRYVQINTSQMGESGKFRIYDRQCTIYDDRFTDITTAQSLLNDVEFCYELATPITYHLTPTEIKSLLGDNNVWADTGDSAVEYRADTKLYIDKKLGTEAPMIATDNIVSGSYFMIGNNLYKATANIASGAAVVVGTNAVAKTMTEALNEINA